MATMNWIPPLPPGYEARWDPNQNAYFFINHNTKQTSWTDPRPEYYAKQPKDHPPPNPKHSAAGETVFGFRGSGYSPKKETTFLDKDDVKLSLLQDMFPDVPNGQLRIILKTKNSNVQEAKNHLIKIGHKCKVETDHSSAAQLQIDNIAKKLHNLYPVARYDVIRDIVAGCNNNEAVARSQLEGMGYRSTDSTQQSGSTRPSTSSGSTRPSTSSRSRSPSPKPAKVSEADKQRVLNKMKSEFRQIEHDFIKMALESCNFDETKFRQMIEHYKDLKSGSTSAGTVKKTIDDDQTFKPSGSLVPETFTGGNEAVVFGHDIDETPSTSSVPFSGEEGPPKRVTSPARTTEKTRRTPSPTHSKQTTSHEHGQQKSKIKPSTGKSQVKISSGTSKIKASSGTSQIPKSPANLKQSRETIDQHAARIKAQKNQAARTKHVAHVGPAHVIESQPRSDLAKGPDPLMRKGPDKELLLKDYVGAYGPNPELIEGPDRSRVRGSMGAVGPDPSLVCGPQQAVHVSPYTVITAV